MTLTLRFPMPPSLNNAYATFIGPAHRLLGQQRVMLVGQVGVALFGGVEGFAQFDDALGHGSAVALSRFRDIGEVIGFDALGVVC